jgi:hypothetical protein
MATILFCWQLGAGFGHLWQMRPLAESLTSCNHRVIVVGRNLPRAAKVFARLGISLLQAPSKNEGRLVFTRGCSFAHLLANVGFGTAAEIYGIVSAWRNLFDLIEPDLIIFDHSPAALLAARGFPAKRILIGSGFCNPPDTCPLSKIRRKVSVEQEARALPDEERILQRVNAILRFWSERELLRLGELYGEIDECFLTTFEELDHYPGRTAATYWGPINGSGGKSPEWPAGDGKRVFAYLKFFPTLTDLLEALNKKAYPTLIYPHGIDIKIQKQYQSSTLRFVNERLNMAEVGQQCDLAILNAGHGTTCDILLAGKPILALPLNAEQQLMAENIERLGAGEMVSARLTDRARMESVLEQLLTDSRYTEAAQRFARKYSSFNPKIQRAQMLKRVLELLEQPISRAPVAPATAAAI